MKVRSAVLTATIVMLSQNAFADCPFTAPRNAELDAAGIRSVVVRARAGDVSIRGSGTSRVQAKGEACAGSQKDLDAIRLDIRRDGDKIVLEAVMPQDDSFMRRQALDLTVELPATVHVQLDDSSGDLMVANVAGATIDDSSGDQEIRDIAGDVKTNDSSGEIEIKNIRGNVELSDSSGDVIVGDVTGNVTIVEDSSGDLTLQRVKGNVRVKNDSSGDIVINDVNHDVLIDNDSSGSIRVVGVGGGLTIENDSSGRVVHTNVLGKVTIPSQH